MARRPPSDAPGSRSAIATWRHHTDRPSGKPLDGGIQLKDGQRLIGRNPVTKSVDGARPTITNTSGARYDGDAIRLANNNLVQNIHIDRASRASVFGVNTARAQVRGNLITNNMIQENNLPRLEALWPKGFVLYESQAITSVESPGLMWAGRIELLRHPRARRPGVASMGPLVIADNVIRDSNLEGIMLLSDTGVAVTYTVTNNEVRDISLNLPRPEALTPALPIVRSRAFTPSP